MPHGRSNRIISFNNLQVEKVRAYHGTPCHDTFTQKRIHILAQNIINQGSYDHLRVPALSDEVMPNIYVMDRIDTLHPIWFGDEKESVNLIMDLKSDLERFWSAMWAQGFACWDFQLYLQEDRTVMMIGFDKFGFRRTEGNGYPVDLPIDVPLNEFFLGDCFPRNFCAGVEWGQVRSRRNSRVN